MNFQSSHNTEPERQPVHLFVPTFRVEECLSEIRQCLERGWTGIGYKTVEFENAWEQYTGLPHAHFLCSATAGLHIAVRLLKETRGWLEGDEVITTPLTFVSTNHAILYERLKPVFADVDDYLCLDPDAVERCISPRTRAILFVGLGGNTGRLEEIRRIAKARGLCLILDAAHMAGTRVNGAHVGNEADATVFSFQAVKNLPTGDAGMLCFQDAALDAEARKWSWLGINKDTYARTVGQGTYKWYYEVEYPGFKYHGNSVMAAIGLTSLRYLDQDNAYRRQVCAWYEGFLNSNEYVRIVPVAPHCESSRHLFQIRVQHRDELMVALNDLKIYPGVHYRDNTLYGMFEKCGQPCPSARKASNELLSLPLHVRLSHSDVRWVCHGLEDACAKINRKERKRHAA